jgi:hypothetical protein
MSGPDDGQQQNPAPFLPSGPISPLGVSIPGMVNPETIQKTQAAQKKIADAVSQARAQDSQLSAQGAGTDPNYSRTEERFQSMTHEQMYEAVRGRPDGTGGMDAAGLRQVQQTLSGVSADLENLSSFHLLGMNNIFNHGLWQGASASAAQAASERFAHAANEIAQVIGAVSQRLDALAWAADAVKLAVPPPPAGATAANPNPDNPAQSLLPGLINPDYAHTLETQRTNARNQAVQALQTLYTPNFPPAGVGIPSYTPPPQINNGPTPAPSTNNGPGITGPGTGTDSHGPASATQPTADHGQNGPNNTGTAADPGSLTSPAGFQLPTMPSATTGTAAGTATAPAGFTPGAETGAGGGYGGGGMGGFAGGGTDMNGGGGSGRSIPGSPNVAGIGSDSRAAAVAGPAAGARMGSMSPHLPNKHSKEKDEEQEHFSPDYLHRIQSEFTDGLPSPVEVIGEDLASTDENPYQRVDDPAAVRQAGYTSSSVPALPDPREVPSGGASDNGPTMPAAHGFSSSRREESLPVAEPNPATSTTPESAPAAGGTEPEDSSADAAHEISNGFSGSGLDLDGLFADYGDSQAAAGDGTSAAGMDEAPGTSR